MLLALDTATRMVSIALHDGHTLIAESSWRSKNNHTVELSPAVEAMMQQAEVTPADLQSIAVLRGPGSFTGLRIGMSFAKGLAFASPSTVSLISIPTLDVVAAAQPHESDTLYALSQAGRSRFNAMCYHWGDDEWKAEGDPLLLTAQDLLKQLEPPVQVAGELDSVSRQLFASEGKGIILKGGAYELRRAGFLAELAICRLRAGDIDDPAMLTPLYLHD